MGAVAGMPGVAATFTGDASLSSRPMKRVTLPLMRMGARIEGGDCLPLAVVGARNRDACRRRRRGAAGHP